MDLAARTGRISVSPTMKVAADAMKLKAQGVDVVDDAPAAGGVEPIVATRGAIEGTTDSMQLFLQDVGRYPLLTKAEEVQLAKRVKEGCIVTIACDRGDRYFAPMRWEKHYEW